MRKLIRESFGVLRVLFRVARFMARPFRSLRILPWVARRVTWPLVVLLVASAIVLALYAVIPSYVEKNVGHEREVEIFLTGGTLIDGYIEVDDYESDNYEIDDYGHFLGIDTLIIRVIVQYDISNVVLNEESFLVNIEPFERTEKPAKISTYALNDDIAEFVYEIEAYSIEGMPGRSYVFKPFIVIVEYTSRTSDEAEVFEIEFEQPQHIGTYFGEESWRVPLRPIKGLIESTASSSRIFWIASSLAFAAFAIFVMRESIGYIGRRKTVRSPDDRKVQARRLRELIAQFRDESWLKEQVSPRHALIAIEEHALHYVQYFWGTGSEDFWHENNAEWRPLAEVLERAYARQELNSEEVGRAVDALELIFADVLRRKGILRTLFRFFARLFKSINRGLSFAVSYIRSTGVAKKGR